MLTNVSLLQSDSPYKDIRINILNRKQDKKYFCLFEFYHQMMSVS